MKAWGDDIANLKRMASTFEKELASMGVDIEALKKGLNDLANRVEILEKRKPAVDIHGNVGMFILAGFSEDGHFGLGVDGRPLGVSHGTGDPSSFSRDMNVFHEGQLVFTGTNEEGPKWKAAVAVGNMLTSGGFGDGFGGGKGNQSTTQAGVPWFDGNDTSIYFQEFNAWWDFNLAGQNGTVKVGRQGHQAGSYFLKRPDVTPYYMNEYWDNGQWMFDGFNAGFHFGNTSVDFFGGRNSGRLASNGAEIQPMSAGMSGFRFVPGGVGGDPDRPRGLGSGLIDVDHMFGVGVGIPLTDKGKINLNYIILDADEITSFSDGSSFAADRVNVFGGDINFNIGSWMLNAGYSQSNVNLGDTAVIDEDNAAWWASLGTKREKWGINFGYRRIEPQFGAPGSWGRIGIWWNPTDIEGGWIKGHVSLNDRLSLHGSAEFYTGTETTIGGAVGLMDDDEVTSLKLDLMFAVNDYVSLWFGAEAVDWDIAARSILDGGYAGGSPEERWYNIGLNYRMSDKASWSIRWQFSDYDAKGTGGFNPFPSFFSGDDRAKGGLITSTLGIRF
jgi:hypothetical protein